MSQRPICVNQLRFALPILLVVGTGWLLAEAEGQRLAGQDLAAALHDEAIVVDGHVHVVAPVIHQGIDP